MGRADFAGSAHICIIQEFLGMSRVCESFSVNRILRSSMIKYKIIGGLILWQEKKNGTQSTNDRKEKETSFVSSLKSMTLNPRRTFNML